jgi:hypothetical protein
LFDDVLPGDYTVEIPAIPFLQKASVPQQIAVVSAATDGDTTIDVELGRLRPEFLSIRDWFSSTPRESVLVAIEAGQSGAFTQPSSSLAVISEPQVQLDDSGATLTVLGLQSDDASSTPVEVQATVPVSGDPRVQLRGEVGDMRLLHVNVGELEFEERSAASSVAPEGESVAAEPALFASRPAEGEAVAEGATVADLFVPTAADVETNSGALVLPLESGEVWSDQPADRDDRSETEIADGAEESARSPLSDVSDEVASIQSSEAAQRIDGLEAIEDRHLEDSVVDAVLSDGLL